MILSKIKKKQLTILKKIYKTNNTSQNEIAEKITKKILFNTLSDELPYIAKVQTEKYKISNKNIVFYQVITVEKKSQKNILIGKNGKKIKEIGSKSRKAISKILKKSVNIFLYVKTKKNK